MTGWEGTLPAHSIAMVCQQQTRRRFVQGGAALAAFSLLSSREVSGQQAARVPRIGFLAVGSREGRAFMIEGLLRGLREHGYADGQNILIEYRFSEDRNDRLPALAAVAISRSASETSSPSRPITRTFGAITPRIALCARSGGHAVRVTRKP